jgi:hypothetical protein
MYYVGVCNFGEQLLIDEIVGCGSADADSDAAD